MEHECLVEGGIKDALSAQRHRPCALIVRVFACAAAAAMTVAPALAADTPPAPPEASDKTAPLEPIVVTGSRISRRDYQSDSPIVTVDQSTLQAAGQPTLDRAIGELPQFAAAQGMSEVGDVQGSTGFAGGQAYGDLRGLGPNRALILMDGRRLMSSNPNGSVDLNTIPMSMIDNVEIITGGASSTYGSDAIAGVLNFKLRQNFSGAELDYRHGETTAGDGATEHVSALLGGNFADNRGNTVLAIEYSERGVVHGADRPFFANIRQLARPPEGIMPAGTFGSPPTIAAVNAVLAGYPGTTPIAGSGPYNGSLGVNTDGTIFTDLAAPNCVQNYKGVGTQKGVNISPNCQQAQVALGQYFAIQVPLTKYNVFARSTYKVTDLSLRIPNSTSWNPRRAMRRPAAPPGRARSCSFRSTIRSWRTTPACKPYWRRGRRIRPTRMH